MISFTFNENTYQAKEGSTWGEWVVSEYYDSTSGITMSGNYNNVYYQSYPVRESSSDLLQYSSYVINANGVYTYSMGGAAVR